MKNNWNNLLSKVPITKYAQNKTSEFLNINFSTNTYWKVQSNVEKASANVRLPKLEISKFTGEPMESQTFIESYETAINSSSNSSNIKKFNYLRCYIEAMHYIQSQDCHLPTKIITKL